MPCIASYIRAALALVIAVAATAPCRAETTTLTVVPNTAYANAIRSVNPRVNANQSRAYAQTLLVNARRMHVDPRLVMALVTVESHWNTRAVSVHGAQGLGQFLPGTARDLGIDPHSARSNLRGVTVYLHQLLGIFKSSRQAMRQAIASYNAGPARVRRYGIPRRGVTQHYVASVMATWHSLKTRLSPEPRVAAVVAVLGAAQRVDATEAAYWGVR